MWHNPTDFCPERVFEDEEVKEKGNAGEGSSGKKKEEPEQIPDSTLPEEIQVTLQAVTHVRGLIFRLPDILSSHLQCQVSLSIRILLFV